MKNLLFIFLIGALSNLAFAETYKVRLGNNKVSVIVDTVSSTFDVDLSSFKKGEYKILNPDDLNCDKEKAFVNRLGNGIKLRYVHREKPIKIQLNLHLPLNLNQELLSELRKRQLSPNLLDQLAPANQYLFSAKNLVFEAMDSALVEQVGVEFSQAMLESLQEKFNDTQVNEFIYKTGNAIVETNYHVLACDLISEKIKIKGVNLGLSKSTVSEQESFISGDQISRLSRALVRNQALIDNIDPTLVQTELSTAEVKKINASALLGIELAKLGLSEESLQGVYFYRLYQDLFDHRTSYPHSISQEQARKLEDDYSTKDVSYSQVNISYELEYENE